MSRTLLALDWNGTVVDDIARAYQALLAVLGPETRPPQNIDEFREGFRLPLRSWFSHLGVAASELHRVEVLWNEEVARHPAQLMPGAHELLVGCRRRQIPVRVVTGAQAEVVEKDARSLGIWGGLDSVVGNAHPKARVLAAWRSTWKVIYVGDTEYDMDQACLAGALPVAFAKGYRPEKALGARNPALVVHELTELVSLLDAMEKQL
jgi:phosphoglycolate phosphatase-like HAD superfamily hydrolase